MERASSVGKARHCSMADTGPDDEVFEIKTGVVLVHVNTTTSTADSLTAFYQQILVKDVEPDLRTRNSFS